MSAPTYVRSGRGGAGNFAPKVAKPLEVEMQSKPVDLEAQQPSDPADATSVIDGPATAAPQYKTYARGGAGNWYEPAALKETGTFNSNPAATEDTSAEKRSSRVWQGRGGAGNWEADQQMKEEIKRKSLLAQTDEEALAATLHEIKKEAKIEAEKEIKPPRTAHVHVPHLDKHQNIGDEVHDI
ncbi:hypothetical protein AOL_s00006g239 [Orbilia oligospora ATCC 24927]|uniref:Uncharacterized protein n=2 Tax=Orbilia oligospora TaxID=2813651 RepID=G1X038_ARTOA|nr:hypothetical protein AOL_s00006g239 [Orbilia oligospora ATCC 24927]EGX53373.1 hypothetical protein AOL_s00006g239 [Orbilia oligospora ATCC 24927]KAF3291202.1 hypothetical protein TWF970_000433 [Orbilia oligospora]